MKEYEIALDSKRNSSPGLDQVHYSMIKNLPTQSKNFLLTLFNTFSKNNIFPDSWTAQLVIPIKKQNKNPNIGSSYRPIVLSSALEKLFETILKNRLEYWLESSNIISNSQFGFRKKKEHSG